jgi:UDP-N-acetylmuramoyl-tripeptide--D-alanyl-D-alanine ligase
MKLDAMARPRFILNSPLGTQSISLGAIGAHNVSNALAAAALTMAVGASLDDVKHGLEITSNMQGRANIVKLKDNIQLLDDSYNASVPAMVAAVDILGEFSAVRWLILGNMAELGSESSALHRQVGEYAASFNFEYVLTYGEETQVISQLCHGVHFSSHRSMVDFIVQQLDNNEDQEHILLVKGANSAGMSKIVVALKEKYT